MMYINERIFFSQDINRYDSPTGMLKKGRMIPIISLMNNSSLI